MSPDEKAQERKSAILYLAVGGALIATGAVLWIVTNNVVGGVIAALLGASAEGAGVRKLLGTRNKS